MPLYDYHCTTCGTFEAWRSLAELSHPLHCPSCRAIATRRISAPNINLNSGWSRLSSTTEPSLVKRDPVPKPSQHVSPTCGRPWMLGC